MEFSKKEKETMKNIVKASKEPRVIFAAAYDKKKGLQLFDYYVGMGPINLAGVLEAHKYILLKRGEKDMKEVASESTK